jgi:alpha-L-rhamnosidase
VFYSIEVPVTYRTKWIRTETAAIVIALVASMFVGRAYGQAHPSAPDALRKGFANPPASARLRCYWWWLNGHTTAATITRDLDEMQKKGYGGVLLVDANGANQNGNDNVPAGPEFGSPEWTALYIHALKEADRLGLELTLNITSGWNLGGPWVQPEQASKLLTWSRAAVHAGDPGPTTLSLPPAKNGFYRQIAVLAYPLHHGPNLPGTNGDTRKPLSELPLKSAAAEGNFSMPDLTRLLVDASPETANEQDTDLSEVRDISSRVDPDGTIHWARPAGDQSWEILRIGYTSSDARVSTSSGTWQGLAIDYLDPTALDQYWGRTVLPLLVAAKPYVGRSLKYLASDSWELGGTNWTGNFREEFRKRRGYDPVLYLPIVSGRIVGSRELSTHFLADLRRTVADLVNGHYDHLAKLSSRFGLGIQCESGGPHGAPFDALETFRSSAIPQTEYWAMSPEHRSGDTDRFFVKEAASAAHIYGRPLAAAEGMTSIGNQWNESLGMNLKPSFDQALTEGMNRLVWHEFTSSPPELGLPGQEYFAGTHLNPNVTWWRDAGQFTLYLNRAQFLLQQGRPVSDVLYYYGDNVPNFVRLKRDDPARVLPGFDYDVTSTDGLLHDLSITSGILKTTTGIRYRALALPRSRILPLAALELAQRYVQAGGVLIGARPLRSQGIVPETDARKFAEITDALWTACESSASHHVTIGKGQLFCTDSSRDVLKTIHLSPDFEAPVDQMASLDYIHRRSSDADIYFIRNTQPKALQSTVALRVYGMQPEVFDAVTGEVHQTLLFTPTADHRTTVSLALEPYGSVFLLFRHPAIKNNVASITHDGTTVYSGEHPDGLQSPPALTVENDGGTPVLWTADPGTYDVTFGNGKTRRVNAAPVGDIPLTKPWTLAFPPNWGAPSQLQLNSLQSWTESTDAGVRYFSGTATYRTTVDVTGSQLEGRNSLWLDLGEVHEVAAVRINGKRAAILWKAPYSFRADPLLHAGENTIEIDVTNLWPNRLIGDAQSPNDKHYTWTNIRKYTKDSPLLSSGLMGPVVLHTVFRLPLR